MTVANLPPLSTPLPEPVTPDDLYKMGQQGLSELVDGDVIEKPMGSLSGETTIIISNLLYPFIRRAKLGKLYAEVSFQCFPNKPYQIRRPDIAFISAARIKDLSPTGHVPIRPDLCVEIVSPGDGVYDLDGKLLDYRSAGVPLTWVINPGARLLRIYKPERSIQELHEEDTLTGENVLPGFSAKVGELLPEVVA